MHRLNDDFAEDHAVPLVELSHLAGTTSARSWRATVRHDESTTGSESTQRAQVEMVVVSVGDEDRVERGQGLDRWSPNLPSHVKDAAEQRISQQPHACELCEDGRVTDVRKPAFGGRH
jgi:hypothetical protein